MWQDLRCKSNTVFPFTFHKTLTDRILESFYKVKGDVAQQRKSLWEAEQFSGIEKQLCKECLFQGTGLDSLLLSWLLWQRGRRRGALEERWGNLSGVSSPCALSCLPLSTPEHPGMGTLKEQRKLGTKSTWEMDGGVRDGNEWIKYSVAACLKKISVNNLSSYF